MKYKLFLIPLLLFVVLPGIHAAGLTVTRELPSSSILSTELDVTLHVTVDESNKPITYLLREYVPEGFQIVNTGNFGDLDGDSEIVWIVVDGLSGQNVKDVTYTYRIRPIVEGTYDFYGKFVTDSGIFEDVTGDTQLQVTSGQGDTETPSVGSISPLAANAGQAQTYSVDVSDNTGVASCSLYIDGVNKGAMSLSSPCVSCTATKTYTFTTAGTYSAYALCSDPIGNSALGTPANIVVSQVQQDTTPPVISNVQASAGSTSTTIIWTTDENSDSTVEYGPTTEYGSAETSTSDVVSHSILLSGLSPATTYHYHVISIDANNNVAVSNDYTFTTSVLTNTKISVTRNLPDIATNSLDFTVQLIVDVNESNKPASYTLRESIPSGFDVVDRAGGNWYSSTRELKWTVYESAYLGTHVADKTYNYILKPTTSGTSTFAGTIVLDSGGIYSTVGDTQLTVTGGAPDTTAPVISNIVSTPSLNSAIVSWNTDELSDSVVEYGTTTAYGNSEILSTLVTTHGVTLNSLTAGTLYHYRVKSTDASTNEAVSSDYTFTTTTAADTTAPVISNIQTSSITGNSVTISWNTDELANGRIDYGLTTGYGSEKTHLAYLTDHSITLTGLTEGTLYHYRVKSSDASSNEATSADYTFTTSQESYPLTITNVQVLNHNFNPASSIAAGGQFNVKVNVENTDPGSKTPMQIVEVLDGSTPVFIGTVKASINSGDTSEVTVGFVLPTDAETGHEYTVKVFNWNNWISQGNWEAYSSPFQTSFTVA